MPSFILDRAKEPSTWKGLITILAAAGVALSPEQATLIVTIGVGLFGLFDTFRKE